MTARGKILACDRCGKTVFMEEKEDGFEIPEGWTMAAGKDICPACSEDFAQVLKQFWGKSDGKKLYF